MNGRTGMRARLMLAALTRRPGMVALAVVAVAIGASVAAALLHVSADVTRKLTRELRVMGPNLILLPDESAAFLDEAMARARTGSQGLEGSPLLELAARVDGVPAVVVGADLLAAGRIHPLWTIASAVGPRPPGEAASDQILIGSRLARRLGIAVGDTLLVSFAPTGRSLRVRVTAQLESNQEESEALFIPLAAAQALADRPGALSRMELSVRGDAAHAAVIAAALERGGGVTARIRTALTRTEAGLLERMRRLMGLVTIAALVSAGLCAFGTLTDLALERRREIALLWTLGATRAEIVRQFALESLAIGLAGGTAGWLTGAAFAQVIGRRVFGSEIALDPGVPLAVVGLGILVAGVAGLGPIRLALSVDAAQVLRGD